MYLFTNLINYSASVFSVLLVLFSISVFFSLFVKKIKDSSAYVFLSKNINFFVFYIPLISFIGSIIYSEVIGYPACKLCLIQRGLVIALVLFSSLSFYKSIKENNLCNKLYYTILIISVSGLMVSGYHYISQLGFNFLNLECLSSAEASCSQVYVRVFDFITIPFMSMSVFMSSIVLSIFAIRK